MKFGNKHQITKDKKDKKDDKKAKPKEEKHKEPEVKDLLSPEEETRYDDLTKKSSILQQQNDKIEQEIKDI